MSSGGPSETVPRTWTTHGLDEYQPGPRMASQAPPRSLPRTSGDYDRHQVISGPVNQTIHPAQRSFPQRVDFAGSSEPSTSAFRAPSSAPNIIQIRSQGLQEHSSTYNRGAPSYSDSQSYYDPMPGGLSSTVYGLQGQEAGTYISQARLEAESKKREATNDYQMDQGLPDAPRLVEYPGDASIPLQAGSLSSSIKVYSQRRPSNRDEFDGPHQLLDRPSVQFILDQERDLPHLPTNLFVQEQDDILSQVNDRLSQCAFDFVAKYQFPIPLESDKRPVKVPADREWTEWVFLLKRLATKRRVPARVLYNGQIRQLVTILENSLEMRHAAKHTSRPLKDDRNVLQLISAGLQVTKMLMDSAAMDHLDRLYVRTEQLIQNRRTVHEYPV